MERRETTDDLDALMESLPTEICERLRGLANRTDLLEVVMDLGRRPQARFTTGEEDLLDREITDADIAHVIDHIGVFGDDNRAGIERTLHRISAIRNRNRKIVGLTCRVGRAVYGTIEIIEDFVETGKSILIMGRPGIGKTLQAILEILGFHLSTLTLRSSRSVIMRTCLLTWFTPACPLIIPIGLTEKASKN